MWEEIPLVTVALVANCANELGAGVESVAHGDHIVAFLCSAVAEQCPPLHVVGRIDASHGQDRGPEVHQADKVTENRSRFGRREVLVLLREAYNERYVGALLPDGVFSARHADAMVGPDDDDGLVPQPVFLERGDDFPGSVVDLGNRVVVARPGIAKYGIVRVVGWDWRLGRIVEIAGLEAVQPLRDDDIFGGLGDAGVALAEVDLGEERLTLVRPSAPGGVSLRPALVVLHSDDVEVSLLVRGVVTRVAHQVGNEFQELRRPDTTAAVMHCADGGRIHPGDDAGSRHRADRADRIRVRVTDAFGGKPIEVRCLRIRVAIAAHHGRDVLEGEVEDVGAARRRRGQRAEEEKRQAERFRAGLLHGSAGTKGLSAFPSATGYTLPIESNFLTMLFVGFIQCGKDAGEE